MMDWTNIVSSFIAGILLSMVSTAFSIVFFILWQQSSSSEMQYAYMIGLMIGETVRAIALHDTYDIKKRLDKILEEIQRLDKILNKVLKKLEKGDK